MSNTNNETGPTVSGDDSLTDYLFDPSAGAPTVGRAKRREESSTESHAVRARRILGTSSSNESDEPRSEDTKNPVTKLSQEQR
jgi:hypothetical protein